MECEHTVGFLWDVFLLLYSMSVCFLVFGLGDQILKLKFGGSPIILWRSIFVWRQHHYWFSWEYCCFIIGWWFEVYVMLVCDLQGWVYILLLINSYCWYDRFCQVLIGALSNSLAMMNMHFCLKEHYYGGQQVFWVSWSLIYWVNDLTSCRKYTCCYTVEMRYETWLLGSILFPVLGNANLSIECSHWLSTSCGIEELKCYSKL